jgi:hypothetical protein
MNSSQMRPQLYLKIKVAGFSSLMVFVHCPEEPQEEGKEEMAEHIFSADPNAEFV